MIAKLQGRKISIIHIYAKRVRIKPKWCKTTYQERRRARILTRRGNEMDTIYCPASFGHFTLKQLAEILATIDLNPDAESWYFSWKLNHGYRVTLVEEEKPNAKKPRRSYKSQKIHT